MSIWDDMVGEYLRGYDGKFYVVTHYDGKGGLYVEEVSEESARLEGSRLRMDVVPNGVQKCQCCELHLLPRPQVASVLDGSAQQPMRAGWAD